MERVGQYWLIRNLDFDDFHKWINNNILEGWTLYGSPFVDEEGSYCQAMVHTDKDIY